MSDEIICSVPPALTDDELIAYLQGKAGKRIREHLEVCAFCRAQLDDIEFGNLLKSALYRFDCPDSQKLADYVVEQLAAYERDMIQNHLAFCLSCKDEVKLLQDFLNMEDERNIPLSQTISIQAKRRHPKEFVARISQLPTATLVRGKLQGPILASISDTLSVFFEYTESVQANTLKGQIVAEDLALWQSAIVSIFHNQNLIATTTVGDLGAFQCELDTFVTLQIRITAPSGESISISGLKLREED